MQVFRQHRSRYQCCHSAAVASAMPLLLLLASSWLQTAAGYPYLWTAKYASGPGSCTAHPTSAYGNHGYDATPDMATTFVVLQASTGSPTPSGNLVCPGDVYTIRATFTRSSHFLLTASVGSFGSRRCDADCLNRVCPTSTAVVGSYNLTLPCDAEGAIELMVTHAESPTAALKTAKISLQVDSTCQQLPTCSGSPQPSPPTPSPAPSPEPPTPQPTQTLTITKSTNRALSLSKPNVGVKITLLLSGSMSQRAQKTLRMRVPRTLNCQPRTLVTDAAGKAETTCLPKAKGSGRVVVAYKQLTSNVTVRVVD